MATPTDRASGIRERLNSRSDGIQDRLSQRHQREAGKLVQNLLDITNPGRPLPTLKREEPRGGIPARQGYAEKNLQPGTGNGAAGIASPLTEISRTYAADPVWVESIEGYGYWRVKRVASITYEDAEGREVVFNHIGTQPST